MVYEAVERDLKGLPERLRKSTFAATALALAQAIDDTDNSLTSRAIAAKELREQILVLRSLAPPEEVNDGLDDLTAKRNARLARTAN